MRRSYPACVRLILTLGTAVAGCGDGDRYTVEDGGPGTEPDGSSASVLEPTAPATPDLGPCPEGWAESTREGVARYCEPYPSGAPEPCPTGSFHLPGRPTCEPVGDACPEGPFAEVPPDIAERFGPGNRAYVLAGAELGDGTRERPFGSVQEALAGTKEVVVLGKGVYPGEFIIERPVIFVGACPTETTVGAVLMFQAILATLHLELRNMTVNNVTARTGSLTLRSSVVRGGVTVRKVDVALHRVSVEGGTVGLSSGRPSLDLGQRAYVAVSASSFVGSRPGVMIVDEASSLLVRDSVLNNSMLTQNTACIDTSDSITVLQRSVLLNCDELGLATRGGTVILDQAVFRGTGRVPGGGVAPAVLNSGGDVLGQRVQIERVSTAGVVTEAGTTVLRDLVIDDVSPTVDLGTLGVGVASDGQLEVSRARVTNVHSAGVLATAGAVALTDVTVGNVAPQQRGDNFGYGIAIQGSDTVGTLQRTLVEGVTTNGFVIDGAEVSMGDIDVRSTLSVRREGPAGAGLGAQSGARITLERGRFRAVQGLGLAVHEAARVQATDISILDVEERSCPESSECTSLGLGIGAGAYGGGRLELGSFEIRSVPLCGLHLADSGTMDLAGGAIRQTATAICVESESSLPMGTETVTLADNVENLSSVALPVPTAAQSLGSLRPSR